MLWQVRNLIEAVIRIIQYIPILWKNHDWDYSTILILLEYKLRRVETALREDPYHTETEKRGDEVLLCRILLKRLIDDDYCSKAYGDHFDRYGSILERKILSEKEEEERSKNFRRISDLEQLQRKADEDLLSKTFFKRYRGWWV